MLQENAITSSNIPLLRILDALRLIKDIPATSPDDCVMNICKAINALSMEQKRELAELSLAYTPYVRALLGAIYENMELENGNHQQNIEWSDQLQVANLRQSIIKQKKLEHHMRLHENWELFSDALQAASQPVEDGGLGIKSIFIEKDYWICRSLSLMAANDKDNRAIFKGGTSLTKAYGIGSRFSYQK